MASEDAKLCKVYEFKASLDDGCRSNFEAVAETLERIYNQANKIEDTECLIGWIRSKRNRKDFSDRPKKGYQKKISRLYSLRLKASGNCSGEYKTQAIKTLHEAWHRRETGFYAKLKKFARGEIKEFPGKPRYKDRSKSKVIRTITLGNARTNPAFKLERNACNAFVTMPDIGRFKVKGLFKRFPQGIKHGKVSLTKEPSGAFYLQFTVEVAAPPEKAERPLNAIGVDPGVKAVLATDRGQLIKPNEELTERQRKRLKRLQRKMKRQQFGSNGYQRTKVEKAKLEVKGKRSRKGFNAKLADWLGRFDVAFEGCRLQNMTGKAKPKPREDGKGYERNGAKAKSGLNKAILSRGIGQIRTLTEARCESRGKVFVKTADKDVRYSSRRCHCCDQRGKRVSQEVFICLNDGCVWHGLKQHADTNASRNHLKAGFGLSQESYPGATGEVMQVESRATLAGQPGERPIGATLEASSTTPEACGKTQALGSAKDHRQPKRSKASQAKQFDYFATQEVLDQGVANVSAPQQGKKRRQRRSSTEVLAKPPGNPQQLTLWDDAG